MHNACSESLFNPRPLVGPKMRMEIPTVGRVLHTSSIAHGTNNKSAPPLPAKRRAPDRHREYAQILGN